MMPHTYHAIVYIYDEDGNEKAYMPCFTPFQVMARAARYPKVKVVMGDRSTFWLKLKPEERDKYPLPMIDDTALELMRNYGNDWPLLVKEEIPESASPQSDIFYDIWKSLKKDRRW